MSAIDFAERFIDTVNWRMLVDDMHWTDSFSAERCRNLMLFEATYQNKELTGLEEFDYETFFWEAYQAEERGLS